MEGIFLPLAGRIQFGDPINGSMLTSLTEQMLTQRFTPLADHHFAKTHEDTLSWHNGQGPET